MLKGKHSRLQLKLCNKINDVTEDAQTAYAFPELRCSFGDRSIVPDIAVFKWSKIPFEADGEVPNNFLIYPDWVIEILSPEQSSNRVTGNILYCLQAVVSWVGSLIQQIARFWFYNRINNHNY